MRQQIKEGKKQHKPGRQNNCEATHTHPHTHTHAYTRVMCVCWLMRANKFQRHLYLFFWDFWRRTARRAVIVNTQGGRMPHATYRMPHALAFCLLFAWLSLPFFAVFIAGTAKKCLKNGNNSFAAAQISSSFQLAATAAA